MPQFPKWEGNYAHHLGEWVREPTMERAIMEVFIRVGEPMISSEVRAHMPDTDPKALSMALGRLHSKGILHRHKVPFERINRMTGGYSRSRVYAYQLIKEEE